MGTDTPSNPVPAAETEPGSSGSAPGTGEVEPVFEITDAALAKVLEIRGAEDDPESLCLRIEVTGVNGVDYTYDLSFETIADLEDDRSPRRHRRAHRRHPGRQRRPAPRRHPRPAGRRRPGRPRASATRTGPTRWSASTSSSPATSPRRSASCSSSRSTRRWRPTAASPRSSASTDTKVFLTMGGGCQGCSMSAATLRRRASRSPSRKRSPRSPRSSTPPTTTAGENPFYS